MPDEPIPMPPPSTTEGIVSATSVLRAGDQRVSRNQIAMILGLIVAVAGGVWGTLAVVYGNQADTIAELNNRELVRLEETVTRLEEERGAVFSASELMCDRRVAELKETMTFGQESLEACLERPLQVDILECRCPPGL